MAMEKKRVDEEWKKQAEAEKDKIGRKFSEAKDSAEQKLPPANFPGLVNLLMSQALVTMGELKGADGEVAERNLELARYSIDLLAVVEERTKGNLSEEEAKFLSDVLHQLRVQFMEASKE